MPPIPPPSEPALPGPAVTAPAGHRRHWAHRAGLVLLVFVLALVTAWTLTALSYQAPDTWRGLAMSVTAAAALVLALLADRRQALAWAGTAALVLAVGLWWGSIRASDSRDWAPEVSRTVTGTVEGSRVVLHDVRDFTWRSETDFTPRWDTRTYDLDTLKSVDLFSSVWGNPAIAHTLIGFGFSTGQRVVFSVEIRRERTEAFSEVGGFFKEFELALIAADENDIVRLRTDARGETVSLYPLKVTPEQARGLFLSYVALANDLAAHPAFYQTATSNCTTVIYDLARLVEPGVPFDRRILLSGYLPDYLYEHGLIPRDRPLAEVRRAAVIVPQRGAAAPYSDAIRARPVQ